MSTEKFTIFLDDPQPVFELLRASSSNQNCPIESYEVIDDEQYTFEQMVGNEKP
jgi:hypothetical protein